MNFHTTPKTNVKRITDIHIGKMIEQMLREQRRSVAWLASQLYCDRTNAYKILKRQNIDIQLLMRISKILSHDFFLDISNFLKDTVAEQSTDCSYQHHT